MSVAISTKLSSSYGSKIITKTVLRLWEDLNTPVSLSCYLLFKYEEYKQLVEKSIDPANYRSAWDFQKDYQSVSILSKYPYLDTKIDKAEVALKKFMEAEEQCRLTNLSLDERFRGDHRFRIIFQIAKYKIESILSKSKISFDDLRFGPGASSSCRGSSVTIVDKLQGKIESGFKARWLIPHIYANHHRASAQMATIDNDGNEFIDFDRMKVSILDHNELFFVPKNAKTDRSICIEPHVNIQGQLMVGSAIRRALAMIGLDLDVSASATNRRLAELGSIDGSYATVDLSSASDTIAYDLVARLLPLPWFELLDSLRSAYTKLPDGTIHENEKFSSMGNGFTFELETLIFYALSYAVRQYLNVKGTLSVYGDDIVVPVEVSTLLIEVLEKCGFKTNSDKTFTTGVFRESCGSDFFSGVNVRPYFIKSRPQYVPEIFKIANGIRHAARRFAGSHRFDDCHGILRRTWNSILLEIPRELRLFGPRDFGDQVIWSPRCESVRAQPYGLSSKVRIAVPISRYQPQSGVGSVELCAALMHAPSRIPLRNSVKGFRIKTTSAPFWKWDEGLWLG